MRQRPAAGHDNRSCPSAWSIRSSSGSAASRFCSVVRRHPRTPDCSCCVPQAAQPGARAVHLLRSRGPPGCPPETSVPESRSWGPRLSEACTPATRTPGHHPDAALRTLGRTRHSHGPWPPVRRDQGPLPQLRRPGHRGRCRSARRDSKGSRFWLVRTWKRAIPAGLPDTGGCPANPQTGIRRRGCGR